MQFAKCSMYILSFEPHKNSLGKVLIMSIFMSEAIERGSKEQAPSLNPYRQPLMGWGLNLVRLFRKSLLFQLLGNRFYSIEFLLLVSHFYFLCEIILNKNQILAMLVSQLSADEVSVPGKPVSSRGMLTS